MKSSEDPLLNTSNPSSVSILVLSFSGEMLNTFAVDYIPLENLISDFSNSVKKGIFNENMCIDEDGT